MRNGGDGFALTERQWGVLTRWVVRHFRDKDTRPRLGAIRRSVSNGGCGFNVDEGSVDQAIQRAVSLGLLDEGFLGYLSKPKHIEKWGV